MTALCALLAAIPAVAARADPFADAAETYRSSLVRDIEQALAGAHALRDRIAAADLAGARKAWIDARSGWERAEVFTSGFVPDLDEAIDAWPDAVTGFHGIEAKLFGANPSDAGEETDALIVHLADVDARIRQLPLTAQGLLDGLTRLAYEVGESKVDGGESRLSGTSLDDMRNNAEGIELAYQTLFAAALEASDPARARAVASGISELKVLLAVPDLRKVDSEKLRTVTEELVLNLRGAAPRIGLARPALEGSP